jgi:hypothetical protein
MTEPEHKSRFQCTLRLLLLATAVVGLLIAVATRPVMEYRHSKSVATPVAKLGGSVLWRGTRISDVRFLNPKRDTDELSYIGQVGP